MDYEKAYKEALKRADSLTEKYGGRDFAEYVFPELAESEDERIRKFICSIIDNLEPKDFVGVKKMNVLAWLEKQKEPTTEELYAEQGTTEEEYIANTMKKVRAMREKQKESLHIPEMCKENPDSFKDEDERIRKGIFEFIRDSLGDEFEDYDFYKSEALKWLEKQKEQKPVEIHIDNPNIQKFDPDVKVTTSDSSTSGKELLYVSNKSYNIGYRDGVNSVKPAEWSEEDENALKYLHELISFGFTEKFFDAQTAADMRKWLNTRLKSLRPQWKPSEEQMSALYEAAQDAAIDREGGNALYELYELGLKARKEDEK